MPLRTDDLQSSGSSRFLIKLDIGTTACHIRGNGYRARLARVGYDLGLKLMIFRVQYLMRNSLSLQHAAEKL